jgi:hypothetical protein
MNELSELHEMRPVPPPAELEAMRLAARDRFVAGTRSRRSRRRWPLPVLAGGLTAAAAAAALVLTTGPWAVPGQHATAGRTRTVVTTAWTVQEDAGGTVTIYLRQYANPAGLQQALQADGVNAIVRPIPYVLQTVSNQQSAVPTCEYAVTDRASPAVQLAVVTLSQGPGSIMPLPTSAPKSAPTFAPKAGYVSPPNPQAMQFIINPGAMPQGSALFMAFMANAPLKTGNRINVAMKPVVLNNDTVPACVPVTN